MPDAHVVVVVGRGPDADLPRAMVRAMERGGVLRVVIVGDRPNHAQQAVIDEALRLTAMWHDAVVLERISVADIGPDDEVLVAASGRERELLASLFGPARTAAG